MAVTNGPQVKKKKRFRTPDLGNRSVYQLISNQLWHIMSNMLTHMGTGYSKLFLSLSCFIIKCCSCMFLCAGCFWALMLNQTGTHNVSDVLYVV